MQSHGPSGGWQPYAAGAWQQPYPASRAPDLAGIARSNAWRAFWLALGGIIFGAFVTVIGLATGFVAIIGIILFLGALVFLPFACIGLFDPTRTGGLAHLGRNANERRARLRYIEAELVNPATWVLRTSSGGTMYISAGWLVVYGSGHLDVAHRNDVLWVYTHELQQRRFGVVTSRKYSLRVQMRHHHKAVIPITARDTHVYPALQQAFPHALFGYSAARERAGVARLAWEVDDRRARMFAQGPPR
jgi:hypothetical protein